jgi:hypothetical protein
MNRLYHKKLQKNKDTVAMGYTQVRLVDSSNSLRLFM